MKDKKKIGFIEFMACVALLMALVSVTINMLLPAFQNITTDFQLKNKNQIHLSISLLYLGLGISQLFYGVLSDSIGRKPTIYSGLVLFIFGCIISYKSSNLITLLIGQIIQGLGLGAPRAISIAIVRDKFEGSQMAKVMSFIMVIYVLTPTVSPILGKSIIMISDWRTLFVIYIIFGVFIFLLFKYRMPETLVKEKQKKIVLKHLMKSTNEVFKKNSLSYILILGLYSGVFITYLNLSQAIFEFQYHLEEQYPYYFAFLALSIGLASFINGKLVNQLGMKRLTKAAIVNSICIVIPFLITNYFITPLLWVFVVFMFVQLFNYGLLIGNLSALAMQPLGHIAGLGASIVGTVSTLVSVPLSIFIGSFYNNSTVPIAVGFFAVGTVSILIFNFVNRIHKNEKQYNQQPI
jgi:DHA1 family bicyclomycin/chloramphenicol resistance-like MFS transporter